MADNYFWASSECPDSDFEMLGYRLFEAGGGALEELETAPAGRVAFRFYAESEEGLCRVTDAFPELDWQMGAEEKKDWDLWWRERQTPVEVSGSLWVRPPWVAFEAPSPDTVVLELEAKTAFGTGEHASTALIVQLMEETDWKGKRLLDIGSGTGILSMFALKKGAASAVCTEIDLDAIPCLVENFERNGLAAPECVLGQLDVFTDAAQFDAIVCNMIRSEVWPLRKDIERLLGAGGEFFISGQLASEKQFVLDWFAEAGFALVSEKYKDEWWAARARKA
jgi:ribosomal protein L11 methyltransferase